MTTLRILGGDPPPCGTVLVSRQWPSRLDLKQEVLDEIAATLSANALVGEDDHPWLCLCLDEALVNAMLHGNEGDPDTPIDIEVAADGDRWYVTVSDRGTGFTSSQVPDSEDPESLLLEHGRGIRIMSEWLDDLTYYRSGATVRMARRRSPTGEPLPPLDALRQKDGDHAL
ncbi:MAG: ATP-binding protein [Planctomycetes bacterium]|nr:ATP-binding protein [Planctomycetota bacterium]